MSRFPHHIARLVRLGLACLVLTAAVAPAQAMPPPTVAIALSVARLLGPSARVEARAGLRTEQPDARAPRVLPRFRSGVTPLQVERTRIPGPPRSLFLVHRALLR